MIAFADQPILAFRTGDLIALGNGAYAVLWPANQPDNAAPKTVLSVQPDGSYETRTEIGAWESALLKGDKLIFRPEDKVYVIPMVDL